MTGPFTIISAQFVYTFIHTAYSFERSTFRIREGRENHFFGRIWILNTTIESNERRAQRLLCTCFTHENHNIRSSGYYVTDVGVNLFVLHISPCVENV